MCTLFVGEGLASVLYVLCRAEYTEQAHPFRQIDLVARSARGTGSETVSTALHNEAISPRTVRAPITMLNAMMSVTQ